MNLKAPDAFETVVRGAYAVITPQGSDLIVAAAPQHVADVRSAFIDQLTPAQLQVLGDIGDAVRERLSMLDGNST